MKNRLLNRSIVFAIVSIVLLMLDALLILSSVSLGYAYEQPIIYPLWLFYFSPLFPIIEIGVAIASFTLLVLSIHSSSKRITLLTAFTIFSAAIIIPASIVDGVLVSLLSVVHPLPIRTIYFNEHIYNLISDGCYKVDSVCDTTAYVVLKCDDHGIICNIWHVVTQPGAKNFTVGSTLEVDPDSNTLYLKIGDKKLPIPDKSDYPE